MKFLSKGLETILIQELRRAKSARLAFAYFCPSDKVLEALKRVQDKKIVVSEEFDVNDPRKLENLKNPRTIIKCVPKDSKGGKLHAKVLITHRKNGTYWALVGSANLTNHGFALNREACVAFESDEDNNEIANIDNWFDKVFDAAQEPDFRTAKEIYEKSRNTRIPELDGGSRSGAGYWVLKTHPGNEPKVDYWNKFRAEGVVAIGWQKIDVNPATVSRHELVKALRRAYGDYSEQKAKRAATKIKEFSNEMKPGDRALICYGYSANSSADVHVYGIAHIPEGQFIDDRKSNWWRFKWRAEITPIEKRFPRRKISRALGKESLRETIHKIDREAFERCSAELRNLVVLD